MEGIFFPYLMLMQLEVRVRTKVQSLITDSQKKSFTFAIENYQVHMHVLLLQALPRSKLDINWF